VLTQTEKVLKQFADQATACEHLGSPFTAKLCRVLADRLDIGTRFGRRILEWTGDPYADNVALRACGALHALTRTGFEPGLVEVYPPHEANEHKLWVAIVDVLSRHDHFLADRLSSPPQTNEVARSGIILGGMLKIAEAFRLPLELYEIGASAGLNLGFDEYRYNLGAGRVWGSDGAPLTIDCAWRGIAPPLGMQLAVVARHGCDLQPIDPGNPADRERLLSYVWADQLHRLERVEAALGLAALEHRRIDKADAADWIEQHFARPPVPGVGRVLFHTIVWQYLPAATQARLEAALQRAGQAATARTPLARLSFEADEMPNKGGRLDLTLWPGGRRITLGRGDFHGRWAEWA
jgi:hypothetical protein